MRDIRKEKYLYIDSVQIVRNSMLWGLLELELQVDRSELRIDIFNPSEEMVLKLIAEMNSYDVAITQDFIPDVAEACHRLNKIYISWIYDAPQVALFKKAALYETNYIFMFDKVGVDILKDKGVKNIYYQPLAANTLQANMVNITDEDIAKYSCDVSFVGSLYSKDYMNTAVSRLSDAAKKDLDKYVNERLCRFDGLSSYVPGFSERLSEEAKSLIDTNGLEDSSMNLDYMAEILMGVPLLANKERITLINRAAEKYNTRLYTNDKHTEMIKAQVHPPVDYETDMYRVFFSSRINLNITWRGIVSGLAQRIFDIGSVGGFVFTNYQSEIDSLYTIGYDIEVFHDLKEFDEKLEHYLHHEKERLTIAVNGYKKVSRLYNYRNAITKMLNTVQEYTDKC